MSLFERAKAKILPPSDVERLLTALERIGDCLELICDKEYGERITPRKADTSGEPPEVTYADDLGTLRHELEDLERGVPQEEDDGEQSDDQPERSRPSSPEA